MFRNFWKMKYKHQLVFALAIGFAVVSFWRGIWGLMDVYLFPGDYGMSSLASFIIGIIILMISHMATEELA